MRVGGWKMRRKRFLSYGIASVFVRGFRRLVSWFVEVEANDFALVWFFLHFRLTLRRCRRRGLKMTGVLVDDIHLPVELVHVFVDGPQEHPLPSRLLDGIFLNDAAAILLCGGFRR